jgi:hypothetical protein
MRRILENDAAVRAAAEEVDDSRQNTEFGKFELNVYKPTSPLFPAA